MTVTFHGDGEQPRGRPPILSLGTAHDQARVVPSHGARADQDGVVAGADLIDPVEVRRVREGEPRRVE